MLICGLFHIFFAVAPVANAGRYRAEFLRNGLEIFSEKPDVPMTRPRIATVVRAWVHSAPYRKGKKEK